MKQKEEIQIQLTDKLQNIENIYKQQIEELINKNYQNINQKNTEIAELQNLVQLLEKEIEKANNYISTVEKQSLGKERSVSKEKKSANNDEILKQQNKKLQQMTELMNKEIKSLNQQIKIIEKQAKKTQLSHQPINNKGYPGSQQ